MAIINKNKSNKNFCTELKVQNMTLYKLLYEIEKDNLSKFKKVNNLHKQITNNKAL